MIYLIKQPKTNKLLYYMFETNTESLISGSSTDIKRLINDCRMEPKNVYIDGNGLSINTWPNKIRQVDNTSRDRVSMYTLLTKITEQCYKLVKYDGSVLYMNEAQLKESIEVNEVANCIYEKPNGALYKSVDTYITNIDIKFVKFIDTKYKEFRAKSLLMGMDMQFKYNIENRDVRITDYTGKSKIVILPNFVTAINNMAFSFKGLKEITLNEGLKYIGRMAFAGNHLSSVEIPKSVEFVCSQAFESNNNLVDKVGIYRDTVKKRSNRTILL